MGVFCVISASPLFDHDAGFSHAEEQFLIEAFITQAIMKGLDVAILPRAARINVYDGDLLSLEFFFNAVFSRSSSLSRLASRRSNWP